MEEECNQFRALSNAGVQLGMASDSFVRDKHIGNIDTLRELDGQLAEIMRNGHEAVENTRKAQNDLH